MTSRQCKEIFNSGSFDVVVFAVSPESAEKKENKYPEFLYQYDYQDAWKDEKITSKVKKNTLNIKFGE